jgi:hypothetical protein
LLLLHQVEAAAVLIHLPLLPPVLRVAEEVLAQLAPALLQQEVLVHPE